MIIEGIGATTHEDCHNCRLTKEALENVASQINNGKYVPSVGIEHDSSLMPIGKTINAKIVELDDGEFAVMVQQETFEKFERLSISQLGNVYITSSEYDNRPFADTEPFEYEKNRIELDPVNFEYKDFKDVCTEFEQKKDVECKVMMRKSLIPDPEIVLNLVAGSFLVLCGKKTLEKTAERLSDNISEDISNTYNKIKELLVLASSRIIPKNRPITYILKENRGYILELVIRTNDTNILFHALSTEVISSVDENIDQFKSIFDEPTYKIQFIFNEEISKWEFNYLSTSKGKVIGSEKCYKKTIELSKHYLEKMRKNSQE